MAARKCAFCFAENDAPRLTKEHLLSRPVAAAFGIDRDEGLIGHVGNDIETVRIHPLDRLEVRAVCDTCNNGWMSRLEQAMPAVAEWTTSGSPLNADLANVLRAWTWKSYIVLGEIAGHTRTWMEDSEAPAVPLEATRARALYEGDYTTAFDGVYFGLARGEEGRFAYSIGNPRVQPTGPQYVGRRSTGAMVLTVGRLQMWLVATTLFLPNADVGVPSHVLILEEEVRFADTKAWRLAPPPDCMLVDYGEHDFPTMWEQVLERVRRLSDD